MVPHAAPCRAPGSSCPFPGHSVAEHEADQERVWHRASETAGSPAPGEGRGLKKGVQMWAEKGRRGGGT